MDEKTTLATFRSINTIARKKKRENRTGEIQADNCRCISKHDRSSFVSRLAGFQDRNVRGGG